MTGRRIAVTLVAGAVGFAVGAVALRAAGVAFPAEARAQVGALRVEVGGGRAYPPAGTVADAATYFTGSLSVDRWWGLESGIFAAISGGLSGDTEAGDWGSGAAGFAARLIGNDDASFGIEGWGYAFRVGGRFPYDAWTVEASPVVRARFGPALFALRGEVGTGGSTVRPRRTDGLGDLQTNLGMWGGGPEIHVEAGSALFSLDGAVLSSEGGMFRRVGFGVAGSGRIEWNMEVRVWDTPRGTETTGGLSLSLPFGEWIFGARGGRMDPDPLTLSEPGAHAGVTFGRRLVTFGAVESSSIVEQVDAERFRFTVEPGNGRAGGAGSDGGISSDGAPDGTPDGGASVALLGDFTDWKAVPMARGVSGWSVEMTVPSGTYHFGFLVDGEWYVPAEAPGRTSDEWGRMNATLVVP